MHVMCNSSRSQNKTNAAIITTASTYHRRPLADGTIRIPGELDPHLEAHYNIIGRCSSIYMTKLCYHLFEGMQMQQTVPAFSLEAFKSGLRPREIIC
jgi:hypothetical protein